MTCILSVLGILVFPSYVISYYIIYPTNFKSCTQMCLKFPEFIRGHFIAVIHILTSYLFIFYYLCFAMTTTPFVLEA